MGDKYIVRKAFPGLIDRYVMCDFNGVPMYTIFDQKALRQTIKNIEELGDIVIRELQTYPDVSGFPGENDSERLAAAIRKWKNANRAPMIIGYARVSTVTQARDGNSLAAQKEALRDAGCEEIFEDVYTGTSMKRPNFEILSQDLKSRDTLVVTKLDRIARTANEGYKIIQELLNRGVSVRVLNMGLIDNTPTGRLILQIMLAFAEFERDMIVQRTQEGKAVARQNPDFHDGRRGYPKERLDYAMELLKSHSYQQVVKMTGISASTLTREKRKRRANAIEK